MSRLAKCRCGRPRNGRMVCASCWETTPVALQRAVYSKHQPVNLRWDTMKEIQELARNRAQLTMV
jgi:hypothetical protein